MSTYRFLVADVLKTHKETFADSKIGRSQVLYWIILCANRLRKDSGVKNDTGMYLSTFAPVPVKLDTALKNRQYIELPASIFVLPHEGAVKYISYNIDTCCCDGPAFSQVFFQPTTAQNSYRLSYSLYEKPDTKNPYFYRVGNRLYFLGLECIVVKDVEVQLFTAIDPLTEVNTDDTIGLSDELISILRYEVVAMARYSYLFPTERKNIGDDTTPKTKVPVQDIVKRQPTQEQPE